MNIRTELKYALISASALVGWVMGEHLLGFTTTRLDIGEYTKPLVVVVIYILLFFGIREKRDRDLAGSITLWQGMRTALLISVLYAVFQAVWFAIYSLVINPEYSRLLFQYQEQQMAAAGKTPQQIADGMAMARLVFGNPFIQFGFFIVSTTVVNTIVGAIMTLFLRTRRNKNYDPRG